MMRIVSLALIALVAVGTAALAEDVAEEEEVDSWVGCWTRVYDAVHLSKHPAQKLTALTLSVAPRESGSEESPGAYSAKIAALVRDKPESFANPESARRAVVVYDGCADRKATPMDALVAEVTDFDNRRSFLVILPYRPATAADGFAVFGARFALGDVGFDQAPLLEAFGRGIGSHDDAAQAWINHFDNTV